MAASSSKPKLIVIVGPTASGKSELAIKIAKKHNGEIITADSRTIYKNMDIGTAKPTAQQQNIVHHWGLDLIEPNEKYSVKQYKDYAIAVIKDIQNRQKLPILVGGSGLYIDALIFDYNFKSSADSDPANPRHRLIKGGSNIVPDKNVYIVGLEPGKEELEQRIKARADKILGPKLISEAKKLANKYGAKIEAFKTPIYEPIFMYIDGKISLDEAKKIFVQNDLKLAKKQRTWFKRNNYILWFSTVEQAEQAITQVLNT